MAALNKQAMKFWVLAIFSLAASFCSYVAAEAEQCGSQSHCWNSTTPTTTSLGSGVGAIITSSLFNQLLLHRNDADCPARGFYTYDAFIAAARSFPKFATTGSVDDQKREIAAFLAQTSHETTGGWEDAPDGPYAWGYCFKEEISQDYYCVPHPQYPCAPGIKYFGRGPIQISYNYNYGQAGRALGLDLLNHPELVATDPVIAFKTALWFWMTPQPPKPSCHDVINGAWIPSAADRTAGRVPGFGVITNIINGGQECGHGPDDSVDDRIGYYKRYCDVLKVRYGGNLDCNNQVYFGYGLLVFHE